MKRRSVILSGVLVALCCAWGARAAYRARHDLVTLDVDGVPLRKVVSMLHRQTWEDIRVQKDVDALITLKVENAPLEAVLGVIARQAEGRWLPVLPIYRNAASLKTLENRIEGPATATYTAWAGYSARPDFAARPASTNEDGSVAARGQRFGLGFGGGPGGGGEEGPAQLSARMPVDAQIENASPDEAAAALRRVSRARIVTEDKLGGRVSIDISQRPLVEAVGEVAAKYGAKSRLYYVIEGRRGPQMTPEQREQVETAVARTERPNMEEMKARMEARNSDPGVQDRMIQRQIQNLKTTTPEQRAEQAKQRRERGGRGGPGAGRGAS